MKLKKILGFGFLIFFSLIFDLSAQQGGTIRGYVRDASTDKPIANANVIMRGTSRGAATNQNGYYEIKNIPPGRYKLEVRVIGYKKQIRGTSVKQGANIDLDFGLLPTVIKLDNITVEARKQEPMPETRIAVKEMKRVAPTTVVDFLKEIPGVATSRAGSWGSKPYFQGMTDSRILTLVDGVKINQACPMGMDACTATIEPDMIESIEVQQGPGAVQYGSGNMGGVIKISTLSSKYSTSPDFRTELRSVLKYKGVSNSRTGMVSFSGGNHKFDFITSFGGGKHDDYRTKQGVIDNSGFESNTFHLKARYRPAYNQQLLFLSQIYRARDIGWPAADIIIPNEKRNTYGLNYSINDIGEKLQSVQFSLSALSMYHNAVHAHHEEGESEQHFEDARTKTYNASLDSYWKFGEKNNFSTGIFYSLWQMSAQRNSMKQGIALPSVNIVPNSLVAEVGVFAQDEFSISPSLKTQLGIRFNHVRAKADKDTAFIMFQHNLRTDESILSGSAAMLYHLKDNITLTASLSKGFKAATPVERYVVAPMIDGYYRIGNPALTSESNVSGRMGIRGLQHGFDWRIEFFHNSLSNLISAEVDTAFTAPYPELQGVKRFVNIKQANVIGGSVFVGTSITESLFFSSYLSYDWGQDRTSGTPLPYLAPLNSLTKLTYENAPKGFWLELIAKVVADQTRYAELYGEKRTPGYAVFDLRGGWQVSQNIELIAGVENIFNRYYRDHLNLAFLPEPGRNVYITARLTLPDTKFRRSRLNYKNTQQVIISVKGMDCQYCVQTIEERLNTLFGVVSTTVSLAEQSARVIICEGIVTPGELITVIERAGFKAALMSIESLELEKNK